MTRAWPAAVTLVLLLAGCGGDDEKPARVTNDRAQHTQAADVGDPPTLPPARFEGEDRQPPRATVIAAGLTAGKEPFEMVMYGTSKGLCISTVFPARKTEGGGLCGEEILPRLEESILATGYSATNGDVRQANGFVSPEVASVELSYELSGETESVDAVVEQIPNRLLDQAGAPEPLGVFTAFLPNGVSSDGLVATAYDSDGVELGTATWAIASSPVIP